MQFWALSSTDIDKNKSVISIKITIDNTFLLPNIWQCPLRPDALHGIKTITQYHLKRGLTISCTGPCNYPILPVKKSNGKI